MKQITIGSSGIEASAIGLGAWAIGGDSNWGPSDDNESVRTIQRARDLGITLVDTAPAYGLGHSEEIVGKALQGRRDEFVLSTKCGLRWDIDEGYLQMERDGIKLMRNTRPESLKNEIEFSLRRLNTDYIDIYIVHWQEHPDFPSPIEDTMGFLMDLKAQGKIRAIGASNLSREQFNQYVKNGELDLIQEKYSMLDRGAEETFFDLCAEHNVTFQPYSPLERGVLTGKYGPDTPVGEGLAKKKIKWFEKENLAKITALQQKWEPLQRKYDCTMTHLVIAWTAAQGVGHSINVLCGARKPWQIEENAGGGLISLDEADVERMRADVEAIS
ncbi:MAG: aldo/keto reductase [Spirochaetota bacterium]